MCILLYLFMRKSQAERDPKGLFHLRATSRQQPGWQQEENQHLVPCEDKLRSSPSCEKLRKS